MSDNANLRAVIKAGSRVDAGGCWVWTKSTCGKGYGQLTFQGKHGSAHRASFRAFKGAIPDGLLVCHTCDVRACVNPDHLYAGTHADNRRDTIERSEWSHPYAARTACAHGHTYADGTYRIARDGSRDCRICNRDHHRRYRERKTA